MLKESQQQITEIISPKSEIQSISEQQYKKIVSAYAFPLEAGFKNSKISDLLKNSKAWFDGHFPNWAILLKFISEQIMPILQRSILSIPINNHNERQSDISRTLKFINECFIPKYQVEVEISKNTLVQTRTYNNKLYKEIILKNHIVLLKSIAKIINQAILCPSSINIQLMLLRLLRRFYYLYEPGLPRSATQLQSEANNNNYNQLPSKYVKNPLFLVLRNISLFASQREQEIKEAAMLAYRIVHQKNDLQLATMIQNGEQFRFLRNSKHYSSKAFTYPNEMQKVYEPLELSSLYIKFHRCIQSRQIWTKTFVVDKPSSLLSWEIYLANYDIKIGIFKLNKLRDYRKQEYEEGNECKQVFKMQKIQNNSSNPNRGHIFMKNGIYRIVFDNSYSLIRNKDLFYTISQLECPS